MPLPQVVERDGVTCYEIPLENKQLLHVPVRAALVDVFRKLYGAVRIIIIIDHCTDIAMLCRVFSRDILKKPKAIVQGFFFGVRKNVWRKVIHLKVNEKRN